MPPRRERAAKAIVVVGSSNTDMIVRVGHLPRPGETILGGKFMSAAGGKGANQAVGAARAGGRVSFIARVGNDALGEDAIAGYVRDGIDVSAVYRDRASPTGVALIFVSADGENCIAVAGGANAKLSPADITRAAPAIRSAAVVVLQLETPMTSVQLAATLAQRAGATVILNPAPARPLSNALLKRVSILTPNETEAELLTGIKVKDERGAAKACAQLHSRGARTVIMTLGARGAFFSAGAARGLVPGFKVKAVDTTAAGDVFNGALAVAVAEGRALPDAIRFANAASAVSVTHWGAQPSAPRRSVIAKFLAARGG